MNLIQALILGLIQGLGEFLPISSSGHLLLAELLMKMDTNGKAYMLLTVLLHVGTLIPIIIVFWKDWWGMLRHPVTHYKLWAMLILASLPALIAHVIGFDEAFESGWFLGVSFLITAVLLLVTELFSSKRTHASDRVGYPNALMMGCFQAVALLPGISRSGSTIAGGILSGLDRKTAAKFSFMMSAPAIAGSLLLEGKDALENGTFAAFDPVPMILAIIVAGITGYAAIRFMLDLINRISLGWFALYVAVLGLVFLVLQLMGSSLVPVFSPMQAAAAAVG